MEGAVPLINHRVSFAPDNMKGHGAKSYSCEMRACYGCKRICPHRSDAVLRRSSLRQRNSPSPKSLPKSINQVEQYKDIDQLVFGNATASFISTPPAQPVTLELIGKIEDTRSDLQQLLEMQKSYRLPFEPGLPAEHSSEYTMPKKAVFCLPIIERYCSYPYHKQRRSGQSQKRAEVRNLLKQLVTDLPLDHVSLSGTSVFYHRDAAGKQSREKQCTSKQSIDQSIDQSIEKQSIGKNSTTSSVEVSKLICPVRRRDVASSQCSVAIQARCSNSQLSLVDINKQKVPNEWVGGVRALRDSHVRLVLQQLRHIDRLNRTLDRAMQLVSPTIKLNHVRSS